MIYAGTAWAAGLGAAALNSSTAAVFAVSIVVLLILKIMLRFNMKSIIFMLCFFASAFGFYTIYDNMIYETIVSYNGKSISYSGTVTDFKDYADNNSVYYLDGKINGKTSAKLIVYTDSIICEPGDKMQFECEVRQPENNYLFSSADYYKSKGFYLTSDSAKNINIKNSVFSIRKILFRFRERVCSMIDSCLSGDESGMLKGMLFGDKSGLDINDREMLYRIGIGHVTAVSGLHLVLFCTLVSFVMNKLKAGIRLKFAITEIFMLLFAVCCGMSPSIMRAFVMMTLINLAPIFFRCTDSFNSVGTAIIILTLPNPFIIANQSFLLSVSGVLGAGAFGPYMTASMKSETKIQKYLKNFVYLLCVSAAVTPVSVLCFGEFSLIAPLTNMLIVPICMAALSISMAASLLFFIKPYFLYKISGGICHIVLGISRLLGNNRFTHMKLTGNFIFAVTLILFALCIFWFLLFKSRKLTAILIVFSYTCMFFICTVYNILSMNILKIALLGNSEAGVIVVIKGRCADVIDTNGKSKNCRYVLKYLEDCGIYDVNNLVILKKPYSAVASYNSGFSLIKVKNVVIPSETYLRYETKICGCRPGYSDFESWSADYFGDYTISVNSDSVFVRSNDIDFICTDGGNGEKKYLPNIVLSVTDNGKTEFRRLENGRNHTG